MTGYAPDIILAKTCVFALLKKVNGSCSDQLNIHSCNVHISIIMVNNNVNLFDKLKGWGSWALDIKNAGDPSQTDTFDLALMQIIIIFEQC